MKAYLYFCWGLTVLLVLGMGFVSGCENNDDDASLMNTWTRHVVDDQGREFDASIQFHENGVFTFELLSSVSGHTSSTLKFQEEGGLLTFYDDAECGVSGRYAYSISGSELRMTAEADSCGPRAAILQAAWFVD